MKVLNVLGTRPEAIKMAPVIRELERYSPEMSSVVCATGQHREMLDQMLRIFSIHPDYDLDVMTAEQSVVSLACRILKGLEEVLSAEQPDLVLVQGDTTTTAMAALAGFYNRVPVGHIEAGLRTGSRYFPFPEEINRRLTTVLATYHFAPTRSAVEALLREGVPPRQVFLTGNPVVDALQLILDTTTPPTFPFIEPGRRIILVTAHRRESFGAPLENICKALREIADEHADVLVVYAVHLNPNIWGPVHSLLDGHPRIKLIPPQEYVSFVHLMNQAYLVLTDSGGIQEEAPALGKPVLVLRHETERIEAVQADTARLVGTDPHQIVHWTNSLLNDGVLYERMACAMSPYGDGSAAERIVRIVRQVAQGGTPETVDAQLASQVWCDYRLG
ncbi:MAG: UDP-N-acetylglucosamine 2-epimerase (non-hydrolyzing) [Anaerolineae bacterium]